jgi:uncharacterized protein YbbK (DUF523 family)
MTTTHKKIYLVSACLMGLCTRYDGKRKTNDNCMQLLQQEIWLPVCPEQLGGLPTPREAADIRNGDGNDVLSGRCRVITKSGIDVSAAFIKGAEQILTIAKTQHIHGAYLKSGSPSCAVSGTIGVTAALLAKNGIPLKEF